MADAIGLGLFSAGGTEIALAQGMPAIVAVLMGVITAAFGGVLRDVFCNEIPRVSPTTSPMPSAFAGWLLVGLHARPTCRDWRCCWPLRVAFGLARRGAGGDWRLPGWAAGGTSGLSPRLVLGRSIVMR